MLRSDKLGAYLRGSNGREALAWITFLAGWTLGTWGLVEATGSTWVWKVSAGLLLLGLFGYGTLWQLFRAGLLGLTDDQDQGATDGRTGDSGTTSSTEGDPTD